MAEVWYAESEIGMKAAVKILSEEWSHNAQMQERFLNEAKVMVQLDHPRIRKVHGYGDIDGRPAIIMEYLDGSDLKSRMKNGERFTDEELQRWWNQMVDALKYTHQMGIVHRDIKPSNIFVDSNGNAKLLDFGIAKVRDSISATLTGQKLGTLMYMSPEQVRDPKRVGPASDAYSLAVTFVHLLTGKAPYDSTTDSDYDIQVSIVTKPVDMSKVPAKWQGFLEPYLKKDATKRPALRHFEMVPKEEKGKKKKDDDKTVTDPGHKIPAGRMPTDKPSTKGPHSGPDPLSPEHNDKPKNKKALWIALAVALLVALVVVLARPKEKSNEGLVEEEVENIATAQNSDEVPLEEPDEVPLEEKVENNAIAADHDYVDLGLPSGTLWATCNVGASKPEDYGDYYAWGETQTKTIYNWETYKYANGKYDKLTKYCNKSDYYNKSDYGDNGFIDNLSILQGSDDAATAKWGSGWRTPSMAQWEELKNNTKHEWTTRNGKQGCLFTAKNGKSVFLPAAGDRWDSELTDAGARGNYWSRSLTTAVPSSAYRLCFYSDFCGISNYTRSNGFSVRPVREK